MNPNRPLQNQRQSQRRPPEKKQAAATLRSRAAGSQDESPGRAIHKIKGKFKGESTARSGCATKSKESAQARLPVPRSQRKAHRQDCLCHEVKGKRTGRIACATKSKESAQARLPVPQSQRRAAALRARHRRVLRTSRVTAKDEGNDQVNGAQLKLAATKSTAKSNQGAQAGLPMLPVATMHASERDAPLRRGRV